MIPYLCVKCGEEVLSTRVTKFHVDRVARHVLFSYWCECSSEQLSVRGPYFPESVARLGLPSSGGGVRKPAPMPQPEVEKLVKEFAFDLSRVQSGDEMEWWLQVTDPNRHDRR